ncbi:MAG: archaetidylserine decarboxylase [Gammaproteobacteria bacterium]
MFSWYNPPFLGCPIVPLSVAAQARIPQRTMTRFFGWLSACRIPVIKNYFIRTFDKRFGINWEDAEFSTPDAYADFNTFFSRRLKPGKRPLAPLPAFVSPVDGFVSQIGPIEGDQLFQAKGHTYTLIDLLAGNEKQAAVFRDGAFATLYLSPKDYHRVHTPLEGRVTSMTFVPGTLFSVNEATVNDAPNLFARNERLICYIDTAHGPMAIILVAALNVGSMFTPWHGVVKADGINTWDYADKPISLARGDEVGGFLMGSTAIVLMPKGSVTWEALPTQTPIVLGQKIGVIKP